MERSWAVRRRISIKRDGIRRGRGADTDMEGVRMGAVVTMEGVIMGRGRGVGKDVWGLEGEKGNEKGNVFGFEGFMI